MKYPHSSIFVPALLLVATFVSSSANEVRTQPQPNERIVNGVIYVDESRHVNNKNCNDTEQRKNVPPLPVPDVNDVIVVEHEDDHTRCRDGSCGHIKVNDNRVNSHASVGSSTQTLDSDIQVSVNSGKGTYPSSIGGGQIKVVNGGGGKGIHSNGGNTIIHVIGSQSERDVAHIPESWLRDTSPIGSRSSQVSTDTLIQILKNSGKLNGGGYSSGYSGRDREDKYHHQFHPDSYGYQIKGNRGIHQGQSGRGPSIRIVGSHELHNRRGYDNPEISIVPTGGRRNRISHGGIDGGTRRYYGGYKNGGYGGFTGGFTGGLSGGEETFEIIDARDNLGSVGYENIELEGGYGGYDNAHYVDVEEGGQIYVAESYENGNYVPAHYDTLYDYLRHHL